MSRSITEQVKSLAFSECANYSAVLDGRRNQCLARGGHPCVFVSEEDMPRCGHFERAVLPLAPALEAVYFASREAATQGYTLTPLQTEIARESVSGPQPRVRCKKCGLIFAASSNRQHYCPECRESVRREQSRARKSRQRSQVI